MSDPTLHGKIVPYSASSALEALGGALGEIKAQDGLTWVDLGADLGVSDDQAAKYADAAATMNVVTFGRGKMKWNGRFTGPFDRLCVQARPTGLCDNTILSTVMLASLEIAKAKENDDQIFDWEVRACRPALEAARDALDELLRKAGP